jgi:hypothetical protein
MNYDEVDLEENLGMKDIGEQNHMMLNINLVEHNL